MTDRHFSIIESTLREGEQFVNAFFTTEQKVHIASLLDEFGVEYIEVTNPSASPQSARDCAQIAALGLRAKVLAHTRCALEDVQRAVETGVDGVSVVIGTSSYLRDYSLHKSIPQIIDLARSVIEYLCAQDVEVRFSTEDSLRSDFNDLLEVYTAVDALHVNRVGIADTVGIGTPHQIYDLIEALRPHIQADIEFHGHNDTGCAVANAYAALEAGATHIDTTVLGIGERNGITSLEGLVARLYASDPAQVAHYNLPVLIELDRFVAETVGLTISFNHSITGLSAFSHKAGIHAKAVLNNPETYEILKPEDFGLTRFIHIANRLTGWNAISNRANQLGLHLTEQQIKGVTQKIKSLSDSQMLTMADVDSMLTKAQVGRQRRITL